MALSSAQRRTLTKAFAARKSTPGGEALRRWLDDPGANWKPPTSGPDGATPSTNRSFPLPRASKKNKYTRGKPKPIPSTKTTSQNYGGKYT